MRVTVLLASGTCALAAACGGQTVGPGDAGSGASSSSDSSFDGSSSIDSGSSEDASVGRPGDGSVMDSSTVTDAAAGLPDVTTTAPDDAGTPPAVGSPACEDEACVICSDGYYHCHSNVFPPCPAGMTTTASCTGYDIPSYGCFYCPSDDGPSTEAGAEGWLLSCIDGAWGAAIFYCTR